MDQMSGAVSGDALDPEIAREIERALAVDPSPEFLARVRTRIAEEPAPARFPSWKRVGIPAAVAVGVVVAAITGLPDREAAPVAPAGMSGAVAREPEPSPAAVASIAPSPEVARGLRRSTAHTEAGNDTGRAVPSADVVIDQEEAAALRGLFAALSARRVDPSVVPESVSVSMPLDPIDEIVLEPIVVSPLPRMGSE